jgi:hypothetical protein
MIIRCRKHLAVRYTRFLIETMSEGCVCVANPFLRIVQRPIISFQMPKEVDPFSSSFPKHHLSVCIPDFNLQGGSSPPPIQEGPRLHQTHILSVQPSQLCGVCSACLRFSCRRKLHARNTSAGSVLNILNTSPHMALSFERAFNSPDSSSYQSPRNVIAARLFMR